MNLRTTFFPSAVALVNFVNDTANGVTSIIQIVSDNSGQYVLFYTV